MDEEIKGMWQRVEFRGRVLASNVSELNSQNEEGREKEKGNGDRETGRPGRGSPARLWMGPFTNTIVK